MNTTLGAPSRARTGAGHAGADSSAVLPITPGNAAPGSYSSIAIRISPASRHCPLSPYPAVRWQSPHHPARMTSVRVYIRLPHFLHAACTRPSLPGGTILHRRRGGEFIVIALLVVLGVGLIAVLAPDDLRRAADRGFA